MAERDPLPADEQPVVEPFQPDPYLWEGRLGAWAKWLVGVIVVFVVVFVLVALNSSGPEPQAGSRPQPATTSSSQTPSSQTPSSPGPSATTGSGAK
jgi:hypothetical protein